MSDKGMKYSIIVVAAFFLLFQVTAICFAASTVTLYLDGAVVERVESAKKGYIELLLPPSVRPDSLKIKPKSSTTINRVSLTPQKPSKKRDQEMATIQERQDLLQDRLKALSVREEIFKSAAKSQSGKAPRKTKTNPEPLAGIRQGTDYAIAQLEVVYTAKRKAEKELKQLEDKKSQLLKDGQSAGNIARILVSPPNGMVTASWIQPDRSWSPSYELRAESPDKYRMSLFAGEVPSSKGEKLVFELSSHDAPPSTSRYRFTGDNGSFRFDNLKISGKMEETVQFPVITVTSDVRGNLPPGEISCYRNGEFLGTGRFPGLEAGGTLEFRCLNR
jgi:hypothetical protein